MQDQKTWFEPYLAGVDRRMVRHYEEMARNLRKTLVYKNGLSPLGLLRSSLEYALNDNTKLTGVFEAVKSELRFTGGRDLLDRITSINEFRNTKVAHQEAPLTDPAQAKAALVTWVEGLNHLWQATRKPG
jgi:type III restriction enzyme